MKQPLARINRITTQTYDLYRFIGEAALSTMGTVYDYTFIADFVKQQYEITVGPSSNPDVRAMFAIINENGIIEGVIAGAIVGNICQEIIWYVIPKVRNSKHGFRLLRALEQWAKEHRCKYMLVTKFVEPQGKGYMKFKDVFIRKIK